MKDQKGQALRQIIFLPFLLLMSVISIPIAFVRQDPSRSFNFFALSTCLIYLLNITIAIIRIQRLQKGRFPTDLKPLQKIFDQSIAINIIISMTVFMLMVYGLMIFTIWIGVWEVVFDLHAINKERKVEKNNPPVTLDRSVIVVEVEEELPVYSE